MSDVPSLAQLKEEHDNLYKAVLATRRTDPIQEEAIKHLLDDINVVSSFIRELGDYLWVLNTAMQWQLVYSTILKMPRSVNLPHPPDPLRGPPALGSMNITSMTMQIADVIGLYGRGKEAARKIEERDADWHNAQVYICMELLTGKIDFAREAPSGSYECLENVWLQDVIQLETYHNWQLRGTPERSTEEESEGDYNDACTLFRRHFKYQHLKKKYDKEDFGHVYEYLLKYFEKDRRTLNEPAVQQLTWRKADRYSLARLKKSDMEKWYDAEVFVRKFYGNIIDAIVHEDPVAITEVSKAMQWRDEKDSRMEIMSCFEWAIVIYFLQGTQ